MNDKIINLTNNKLSFKNVDHNNQY